MEIIRYELERSERPGWDDTYPVITIGNFDGVHIGHQKIFNRVKEKAREVGGKAVVFTFEPHPLKLLRPEKCPLLITPYEKRVRLIEHFEIDATIVARFTHDFAALTPDSFFLDILKGTFNVHAICIGYDFSFGRDRVGSLERLRSLGKSNSVEVEIVAPVRLDGIPVSSTRIRQLVAKGKMKEAKKLLGRYFFLSGEVVKGHNRGQRFGFPTANIETGHELFPLRGVYATFLFYKGRRYRAVTNIGVNPTFNNGAMSIETYVLDFSALLYGEEVSVSFVQRIRDEICFPSIGALAKQIGSDVKIAEDILIEEERVNPQNTPEG